MLETCVTTSQVSTHLLLPQQTPAQYRADRIGPPSVRGCRAIRHSLSDVELWLEGQFFCRDSPHSVPSRGQSVATLGNELNAFMADLTGL